MELLHSIELLLALPIQVFDAGIHQQVEHIHDKVTVLAHDIVGLATQASEDGIVVAAVREGPHTKKKKRNISIHTKAHKHKYKFLASEMEEWNSNNTQPSTLHKR